MEAGVRGIVCLEVWWIVLIRIGNKSSLKQEIVTHTEQISILGNTELQKLITVHEPNFKKTSGYLSFFRK